MKKIIFVIILNCLILNVFSKSSNENYGNLLKEMEEVKKLEQRKKPKSASEKLKEISAKSLKQKELGIFVLSRAKTILNDVSNSKFSNEKKIGLLEKSINSSDKRVEPVLQTILATWYTHYYNNYRYQFQNRTKTAKENSDISTWDLKAIYLKISTIYNDLLINRKLLSKIKIGEFRGLIQKGSIETSYLTTMYEFVLHQALTFYKKDDFLGVISSDEMAFKANSPLLGDYKSYLKFEPTNINKAGRNYKLFSTYKMLLEYYISSKQPQARLLVDLDRLGFFHKKVIGDSKDQRYLKQLNNIEKRYSKKLNAFNKAVLMKAKLLFDQGKLVDAKRTCKKLIKNKTIWSDNCKSLTDKITKKALSLNLDYAVGEFNTELEVKYKNISKIYFRIYKGLWKKHLTQKWGGVKKRFTTGEVEAILKEQPIKQWSSSLPTTNNYKQKVKSINLPKLKTGFYYIFVSTDKAFKKNKNRNSINYSTFWKTNITLLLKSFKDHIEGVAVDSSTGQRLKGAKVVVYKREKSGSYKEEKTIKTDEDGVFQYENPLLSKLINSRTRYLFYIIHEKNGEILHGNDLMFYRPYSSRPIDKIQLFTDKAIYRPNQKIKFKGICIFADQKNDIYKTTKCRNVTLSLFDINHKLVKKVENLKSNKWGSFNGAFQLPKKLLGGIYSIRSQKPYLNHSVRVEEYKKPKFEITIFDSKFQYQLGKNIKIRGRATNFSGLNLAGAKVRYEVVREIHHPWWFFMPPKISKRVVDFGNSITKENGEFNIDFIASKELTSDHKSAYYSYKVAVTVIDKTGESQKTSKTVKVGHSAFSYLVEVPEWIESNKPFSLMVKSINLDKAPVNSRGKLELFLNGKSVHVEKFLTVNGEYNLKHTLPKGMYKIIVSSKDKFKNIVTFEKEFVVIGKNKGAASTVTHDSYFAVKNDKLKMGDDFEFYWSCKNRSGEAFVRLVRDGNVLESFWIKKDSFYKRKVTKDLVGGFSVLLTSVYKNRVFNHKRLIDVLRLDKKIVVKLETFRSKLTPNVSETWKIKTNIDSEVLITIFDASMENVVKHNYYLFSLFWKESLERPYLKDDVKKHFISWYSKFYYPRSFRSIRYPDFISDLKYSFNGVFPNVYGGGVSSMRGEMVFSKGVATDSVLTSAQNMNKGLNLLKEKDKAVETQMRKVNFRKAQSEDSIFIPSFYLKKNKFSKFEFKVPNALTKWKVLVFAHGKKLQSGVLQKEFITQKEIMLTSNPPRFFRSGDKIDFSIKANNQTDKKMKCVATLIIKDLATDKELSSKFIKDKLSKTFYLSANGEESISWQLNIPEVIGPVKYQVSLQTPNHSDGEEGKMVVLPSKILVKESLPLWITQKGKKQFSFKNLKLSKQSKTIKHLLLSVQMSSNPIWYAIGAIPSINIQKSFSTDQLFSKLFVSSIGKKIITANPKIKKVINKLKEKNKLKSNLERNASLKDISLEMTPWLKQAKDETEAMNKIVRFFDNQNISSDINNFYNKLKSRMLPDGGWSWLPGGKFNFYITLNIVTGFGKLKKLGIDIKQDLAVKSISKLDQWIKNRYLKIVKNRRLDKNNLTESIGLYLYARSFYSDKVKLSADSLKAFNYYRDQSKKYWFKINSKISQAHIALSEYRYGNKKLALEIIDSFKQRALFSDELGMYWEGGVVSSFWYHAPIETHVSILNAFSEISASEKQFIFKMKIWLLKQKQTQSWKSTNATIESIYALIENADEVINSNEVVKVKLGNKDIIPANLEVGSQFYDVRIAVDEIDDKMSKVSVEKKSDGVAWGGVFWQYFENINKVKSHKGSLSLTKKLFIKRFSKNGNTLFPLDKVKIIKGDILTVKIILKVDRSMEYLHMYDHRPSGAEPVHVLSGYKYQDGLSYYQTIKDTSTHFFFENISKGTYVFEYDLKIYNKGQYSTGIASIQSVYAPEFNSHSKSYTIEVVGD